MQTHSQNHSREIKQLSNQELLAQTKLLVQKERNLHIQVLHHLKEIDSRKLYFKMGFSNLFDYAVKELSYSEGAAYRRIKAMKLCRDLPETESRLKSGRLSLSTACQLQTFFEKQTKKVKAGREVISFQSSQKTESSNQNEGENQKLSEKQKLIKQAEGRSTRATMKLLAEADPSVSISREQTRFLGKEKVEIKVVIDEECHKRLEELKSLLSHRNPNLSYGELLSILSEEALQKHDPRRRKTRQNNLKIQTPARKPTALSEKPATSAQRSAALSEKPATSAQRSVALSEKPITFAKKLIHSTKEQPVSTNGAISLMKKSVNATGKPITSAPKSVRPTGREQYQVKKISRAVPSYLRKYIWERDGGQCSYIHHETKRRCASRYLLQIDHIKPFALGGKTESENLRLLCAGHNQYRK